MSLLSEIIDRLPTGRKAMLGDELIWYNLHGMVLRFCRDDEVATEQRVTIDVPVYGTYLEWASIARRADDEHWAVQLGSRSSSWEELLELLSCGRELRPT